MDGGDLQNGLLFSISICVHIIIFNKTYIIAQYLENSFIDFSSNLKLVPVF